jgi:hypothetical protein
MTISRSKKGPRSALGETNWTPSVKTIRRLGYAQNNQVRLYGEAFDLVPDPASIGKNFVFVDALDRKGHVQARPSTDHPANGKNKTSRGVGHSSTRLAEEQFPLRNASPPEGDNLCVQ